MSVTDEPRDELKARVERVKRYHPGSAVQMMPDEVLSLIEASREVKAQVWDEGALYAIPRIPRELLRERNPYRRDPITMPEPNDLSTGENRG